MSNTGHSNFVIKNQIQKYVKYGQHLLEKSQIRKHVKYIKYIKLILESQIRKHIKYVKYGALKKIGKKIKYVNTPNTSNTGHSKFFEKKIKYVNTSNTVNIFWRNLKYVNTSNTSNTSNTFWAILSYSVPLVNKRGWRNMICLVIRCLVSGISWSLIRWSNDSSGCARPYGSKDAGSETVASLTTCHTANLPPFPPNMILTPNT